MKPGEKKKKKRSKVYWWPISARSFTIPYSSIDSPHKKKNWWRPTDLQEEKPGAPWDNGVYFKLNNWLCKTIIKPAVSCTTIMSVKNKIEDVDME